MINVSTIYYVNVVLVHATNICSLCIRLRWFRGLKQMFKTLQVLDGLQKGLLTDTNSYHLAFIWRLLDRFLPTLNHGSSQVHSFLQSCKSPSMASQNLNKRVPTMIYAYARCVCVCVRCNSTWICLRNRGKKTVPFRKSFSKA